MQFNREKLAQLKPMEAMEHILNVSNDLEKSFQSASISFPQLIVGLANCRIAAKVITKNHDLDEFESIHMDQLGSRLGRINLDAEDVIRHKQSIEEGSDHSL